MENGANNISEKLIQAVNEYKYGNREAFRVIYSESEKYIFTCVNKAFAGHADITEKTIHVMKNTYSQIAEQIFALQDAGSFLTWAGMLTVQNCYFAIKHDNAQVFHEPRNREGLDRVMITGTVTQEQTKQNQLRQMLNSSLSDTQRLCLMAHYYNNQSVAAMAQGFGVPEPVVFAALQDTNRSLQDIIHAVGYSETEQYAEAEPWLLYFFLDEVYYCNVPNVVSANVAMVVNQIVEGTNVATDDVDDDSVYEDMVAPKKSFFAGPGGIALVVCICLLIVAGTGIFVWRYLTKEKKDTQTANSHVSTSTDADGQTVAGEPYDDTHTASGLELVSIRSTFADASETKNYEITTNPSIPSYTVNADFSNIANAEAYSYVLSDESMKQKLLQNGFVVVEGWDEEFFSRYEENRYNIRSNFVTTDSILHTYHLYFAYLLKNLEKSYFYEDLKAISNQMITESKAQYDSLAGTTMQAAAKRNMAYFTVAAMLLDPNVQPDPLVADVVNEELSLIEAAGGMQNSPIMAMDNPIEDLLIEDYTQYKPRGYYAESEELSRYFKAMMWFGRISFRQAYEEEAKSAFLMNRAMKNADVMSKWSEIYDVTSFFMGTSDDPGVYDYFPIIEAIYGDASLTDIASDTDKWNTYMEEIASFTPPAINSIPVYDDQSEEERAATITAFRFMGQRSTFDAAAFQKLIYRQVEADASGKTRGLPSAMDIPGVFGSSEAEKILDEQGAFGYKNYRENFDKIKNSVAGAEEDVWNASVYNSWLNTLRPLCKEKGEGYPMFMQNSAWTRKQLSTFLGSFAELKHDSILYAKQVYAEMGGGGEIPNWDDRGYVEPEPEVYAGIAKLSAMTRDGLDKYGMISDEDKENLTRLQELSEQLLTISNKELSFTGLTEEEYELIRTYGGNLEHFWYEALKDEAVDGYLNPKEHPAAIIADIATDPGTSSVLEVGTGKIDTIYAIINVEGTLLVASGSVYSYYEFAQPMDQRLTDQEWRYMLGIDYPVNADGSVDYDATYQEVERPSWTKDYIVTY